MSTPQAGFDFKRFDAEAYFIRRLREHRQAITVGVTDPAIRRDRIREAIIAGGLECAIIGRGLDGKTETYAAAFERFYLEPLTPKRGKERKSC